MSIRHMLSRSVPLLAVMGFLVAAPAFGSISVTTDANNAAAATYQVSVTSVPAIFSPNPIKVAAGDQVTWNVNANAFQGGEATAEVFIKPGYAIAPGVVAGPSGPGVLSGSLTIPGGLREGTVVKYGIRWRNGGGTVVREVDPDIVIAPGLGTAGLTLLTLVLAGFGAAVLIRRRPGAPQGA